MVMNLHYANFYILSDCIVSLNHIAFRISLTTRPSNLTLLLEGHFLIRVSFKQMCNKNSQCKEDCFMLTSPLARARNSCRHKMLTKNARLI